MRWRGGSGEVGLEGDCRRFVKVIRYQRRCVVLWRESAAYGRWKSTIAPNVQSALRLVRRAESGEQSRPGSPAAAGLWLGRWGRAAPAGCPSPSPACPPMCRCACPAPHCAPAALTPGHTSHSGSNEGEGVNVFGEAREQEDREGRGGGWDTGGREQIKDITNLLHLNIRKQVVFIARERNSSSYITWVDSLKTV